MRSRTTQAGWMTLSLLLSILPRSNAFAEEQATKEGWSVAAGGFVLPPSLLLLAKGSYEFGHFAVLLDVTRDSVSLARAADARDAYVLWAGSLGARAYTGERGRGAFAELSLGYAALGLETVAPDRSPRSQSSGLPIAGVALGVRLGQHPTGVFGELGARGSFALSQQLLYTTDAAPAAPPDGVGEGSWYFRRGAFNLQLYLGVGYSF